MSADAAGVIPPIDTARGWRAMGRMIASFAVAAVAACAPTSAQNPPGSAAMVSQGSAASFEIDPGDSQWGSYLAGRYAHTLRDYGSASRYLVDALKRDSGNLDLLRRSFLVTLADGRMDEARELAAQLVKLDADAPFANLTLVVESIRQGDWAGAEKRLSGLAPRGPNSLMVPILKAWVLAGQRRIDEAQTTLAPLEKFRGFGVLYHLHAGMIADFGGDEAKAESHFLISLKESERLTVRLVEALGGLYQRTGRAEKARELYVRYRDENPDSLVFSDAREQIKRGEVPPGMIESAAEGASEAFFNIAGTLTRDNTAPIALMFGRLALELQPDFPIALVLVGRLLDSQGQYMDAIKMYDTVNAESPFYWSAQLQKAASLEAADRPDEAIAQLRYMATLRKDRADPLINLGDLLRANNRFAESVDAYDEAIRRIGTIDRRHWSILYSRGIAFERSKRWDRAEQDFMKALELNPEQPYVLNYLGYSWIDQGINVERAKDMIERAVKLRPNDGFIVDSLGWVLYRMKDYRAAVVQLERAVELRPHDSTINDHLGDAYWKVNRFAEARFQWQRALSLDPEPETIGPIQKKIQHGLQEAHNTRPGG